MSNNDASLKMGDPVRLVNFDIEAEVLKLTEEITNFEPENVKDLAYTAFLMRGVKTLEAIDKDTTLGILFDSTYPGSKIMVVSPFGELLIPVENLELVE